MALRVGRKCSAEVECRYSPSGRRPCALLAIEGYDVCGRHGAPSPSSAAARQTAARERIMPRAKRACLCGCTHEQHHAYGVRVCAVCACRAYRETRRA